MENLGKLNMKNNIKTSYHFFPSPLTGFSHSGTSTMNSGAAYAVRLTL